ncbi:N-acetylmuramoyl-L-alanine amidase [Porcipelethomonas ammoniilytica]|uniref:N-acetylmuramoyl-L-alanine amidase n=1 Tax=Porcipelethomonas ammoniilytica TaxID=2981722 RepID=UPI000822169D|nr:N-acetylmuramoyl-L-alanine amidase [Porcipelethomonas ammoniilytica]MCU6719812.1 N-acetylmuramoyl-L-alanine amidase [Porcipelethomonas ammoniilytica]SCI92900.1 Sporulation-specific N-acetylmuramoyl-L-alanine amidase [uncultured Ruminococcus sp.]
MSKKVFIGVRHGGTDSGAVKYIVEKEYTLKTAFALSEILSKYGVDFKLSRTQDIDTDMDSKVAMCNKYAPDLAVDIHFNAGGGQGFEVYYSRVGGTSKTLANNINTEVKKIMSSRGVKTKLGNGCTDYFAIIRETAAPAVLLEGGFVDSKKDADFIKSNYKRLAEAYAKGILKTLGISTAASPAKPILDKTGRKKGNAESLELKVLLLIAKKLGIHKCGMDENKSFGTGTLNAVNYLLGVWGYQQNGIAGENFIKRLHTEIENKVK